MSIRNNNTLLIEGRHFKTYNFQNLRNLNIQWFLWGKMYGNY